MNRVQRLAAIVAELRARKLAEVAVPLATAELQAAGFKVHLSGEWGLSVDAAPGLRAALDDLSTRGLHPPKVFILRNLYAENEAEAFGEDEKGSA